MCILLIAYRQHPEYDLIVAANRDEFYSRPSAPVAFWDDHPQLLAGRDLLAGGTWLGVNTRGHFAAVTNLRGGSSACEGYSRGFLVRDFLLAGGSTPSFLSRLAPAARRYAGCNLLLCDNERLWWWSNVADRELSPGVYGVSNSPLDYAWPKVERLKAAFSPLAQMPGAALMESLFAILRDAPPNPGATQAVQLFNARLEETIFVHTPTYGTRCSSILLRDSRHGSLDFAERRYSPAAAVDGESRFRLDKLN